MRGSGRSRMRWPWSCQHVWVTGTMSGGERVKICSLCDRAKYICEFHPYGPRNGPVILTARCSCPRSTPTFAADDPQMDMEEV